MICEFIRGWLLILIDGALCWFPGAGWNMSSLFFILMVNLKLCQALRNRSSLCCISTSVWAFIAESYHGEVWHS